MLRILFFILHIFPVCIFASNKDTIAERFANSISITELKTHIYKLASDEFEGRGSGERGQYLAADYIRNHFLQLGLKGPVNDTGYFQQFTVNKIHEPELKLSINNTIYSNKQDYFLFNQNKYILPSSYSVSRVKEIVSYLEITKKDKASAIFLNFSSNDINELVNKYIDIIEASNNFNVTLLFFKKPDVDLFDLMYELRSVMFKNGTMSKAPILFITDNVIFKKKSKIYFVIKPVSKSVHTQNVLGFIKGKTDETVVISSHYDHLGIKDGKIYYGADDNASGTTAVLNLATAFSNAIKSGFIPKRNILFITFSGEEIGLLGSKHYTDIDPIIPLKNIAVNINIDMIGRSDYIYKNKEKYIYVIGSDKLSTLLHNTNEEVNYTYQNLILDYKYNSSKDPNRFYYRSDHYNFAKNNIPVIFFFNGLHDDYHKFTDTPDKIDLELMEYRIKHFFYLAWKLVNMDETITVDVINSK
ncbi:MAG: M28 family metallopeptidase [Bacteroidia bacterium]